MRSVKRIIFSILIMAAGFFANAQIDSLDSKFQNLMENSETFKTYKVIKITTINEFWAEVMDTLNNKQNQIDDMRSRVASLQQKIDQQSSEIENLNTELQQTKEVTESIEFIGIMFSKTGYHIMVWVFITLLLVGIIALFVMYQRSHNVTAKAQKEFQSLMKEYEAYKDKAREKQVKLKRELQTAVNTLEEVRRGKSK